MTISYQWLGSYIHIDEPPEVISEWLTSTGLEVEHISPFENIRGGLAGLLVGEVLTCVKHPQADKLSLTTVDVGEKGVFKIVCGAPNVAVGQKVIVAIPDTTIYPTKGEPVTIRKTKIRGEASEGMICAADEVGLGNDHSGILVLERNIRNGTPVAQLYDIYKDYIIEIGLTPNRADAASHIGVARDLRALTGREIVWPDVNSFRVGNKSLTIPVEIEDTEGCFRYSALTISGIQVKPSPPWLANRLLAIGLTPINNVVDVTNYVCHEMGQPLHAFNADEIEGRVVVKTLPEGTQFTTLDDKVRELKGNDLMICDETKGLCIAGVFGGKSSGINEHTTKVFLESACFNPNYIRRTSQQHQLKTDASFRFERGTDPAITVYALKRAALLIQEVAGGEVSSEIIDIQTRKTTDRIISIKQKHIDRLIGQQIPRTEVVEILGRLDIQVIQNAEDGIVVSVPPYRVDVLLEADVIEEILRIYGFNRIDITAYPKTDYLADFPDIDANKIRNSIGNLLAGNGFNEIWTNSLTSARYQEKFNLDLPGEAVEILNKLSEEQAVLRQTLLFSGLEVCMHNINRKQRDLRLFEFGKIYYKTGKGYEEKEVLALFLSGNNETENWQRPLSQVTYFDLAQQIYQIIGKCAIDRVAQKNISNTNPLEYGSILTRNDKAIGRIGKVMPAITRALGIKQEIFYGELDASLLFLSANPKLVIRDIPKYPEVRRDLSLVLDTQITYSEIEQLVLNTERRLVKNVLPFDVYEGENIPKGKKAYALRFTLQDESKTLTEEEIEASMNKLMRALEKELGAVIRK